mmetsp:Transcript_39041/g.111571  ORF Transcript_39041/g.111571 Transcript_39041/m.111571 type:complete len:209 (-) Transcript_39041:1125-1751(-)
MRIRSFGRWAASLDWPMGSWMAGMPSTALRQWMTGIVPPSRITSGRTPQLSVTARVAQRNNLPCRLLLLLLLLLSCVSVRAIHASPTLTTRSFNELSDARRPNSRVRCSVRRSTRALASWSGTNRIDRLHTALQGITLNVPFVRCDPPLPLDADEPTPPGRPPPSLTLPSSRLGCGKRDARVSSPPVPLVASAAGASLASLSAAASSP